MKIAVIGSGKIGATLGKKWAAAGHTVVFGVRDPGSQKVRQAVQAAQGDVHVAPIGDAIEACEIVLLAVPGAAVEALVDKHAQALHDKMIIDATNRFDAPVVSAVQAIRAATPADQVFRAFNSLGWEIFDNPLVDGQQPDLFYCGPEGAARQQVEQLIRDVGVRPVYVGGLENVTTVDALGALWVTLVFRQGHTRRTALKLFSEE